MKPNDHVKNTLTRLLTQGLNARSVEIAYQHAEEWVSAQPPASGGERGGSSSPTEIEEAQAIRRVNMLAARGLLEIPRLAKLLDNTAKELHDYTKWLTALDLSKYEDEPWCAHHKKYEINEPLGSRPRAGNCGWCDDFRRAEGVLPPQAVLEARSRGERITARLVAESLGRKAS